jgi:hypothetical protein
MAWDESEHPIMKWVNLSVDHLPQIGDLELATLKVHLVLEDCLRYLLAARLALPTPETALSGTRIEFSLLLELAFAGNPNGHLCGALRAINSARNALAHHVESPKLQEKLAIFCQEAGYIDGTTVKWPMSKEEQLIVLKQAFDDAGVTILKLAIAEQDKLVKNQPGA